MDQQPTARSPALLLLLLAGPLLVIITGLVVFGGDTVPRYLLRWLVLAAAAGVAVLGTLILLADAFRRDRHFSRETFWLALLLALFVGLNVFLLSR